MDADWDEVCLLFLLVFFSWVGLQLKLLAI